MCNLFCWCVLIGIFGLNAAWVGRPDQRPIVWAPTRRSNYCVKTGEECRQTSQCCGTSSGDVCLTSTKYAKYGGKKFKMSTCQNVKQFSRYMTPYKKAGYPCKDSAECYDLCCREVRGHRYGVYHVCGKAEDRFMSYRCTTSLGVRGANDVIDMFGDMTNENTWS